MIKPFSQACENNKSYILLQLKDAFKNVATVLEIGSGTGQHSVYFASQLPYLQWFTSDREVNHEGIKLWHNECELNNLHPPLTLDLNHAWPVDKVDAIFTANTLHIISWPLVERFFTGVKHHLNNQGVVCIYGPFKYNGEYTSLSNRQFDALLNERDVLSGIKDFEVVRSLAEQAGLTLVDDVAMPANNQLLIFKRQQ